MIKQIIVFLSCLIVPFNLWAKDACTNPDEYTVDKRCYVTSEQKKEKPYNAVVALVDESGVYCTGTIVSKDNKLYLYTAKHCTDRNRDKLSDSSLRIKTQKGKKLNVSKNNVGSKNLETKANKEGDWAIYDIEIKDLDSVNITTNKKISDTKKTNEVYDAAYDTRVVGYGSLKIMSDTEIQKFKDNYISWLKKNGFTDEDINVMSDSFGVILGNGIHVENDVVLKYIKEMSDSDVNRIFKDEKLKQSECKYISASTSKTTDKNYYFGCQSFAGNSGGPIFDDDDNLMAIITQGVNIVGGNKHAILTSSISLLQPKETKIEKVKNVLKNVF